MSATVIVPTFNEAGNIEELVRRVVSDNEGIKVIAADDGSKDGTQQIVSRISAKNSNVSLLDRSKEKVKGLTVSVTDAVKLAKTDYVVVIDADLQHPPEKVKEIIKKLEEFDIVVGTRRTIPADWPLSRKVISKTATMLARLRLMRSVKDPVSGFFGARTALFKQVLGKKENKFEPKGYKVLFDLLKYCPRNTKIGAVYYDFGLRKSGSSKISGKQVRLFFKSLFK